MVGGPGFEPGGLTVPNHTAFGPTAVFFIDLSSKFLTGLPAPCRLKRFRGTIATRSSTQPKDTVSGPVVDY